MTATLARQAFDDGALAALAKTVADVKVERARLSDALRARPFVAKVYPSDANFVVVKLRDAPKAKPLYAAMAAAGVVVRYRGDQANLAGCLRVTVGTRADTDAFLACLDATAPSVLAG